jgi:hypothetical protein
LVDLALSVGENFESTFLLVHFRIDKIDRESGVIDFVKYFEFREVIAFRFGNGRRGRRRSQLFTA